MKRSHNLAQEVLARPATEAGPPQNESVEECKYSPVDRRKTAFDPQVMQQLLDGEFSEVRNLVKQLITKPDFTITTARMCKCTARKFLAGSSGLRRPESAESSCPVMSTAKKICQSSWRLSRHWPSTIRACLSNLACSSAYSRQAFSASAWSIITGNIYPTPPLPSF